MKTTPLFVAKERFDSSDSAWENYCKFAKIPKLTEVVSLDCPLCPDVIKDIKDEDWPHIVNENFGQYYFCDLDYLLKRAETIERRNILGLYRNPDEHIQTSPAPDGFAFIGYDLIDEAVQVSALTNCGGFPDVFSNDELNCCGLLNDFIRACEVRTQLAKQHPEEPHAQCELYAIWRLNEAQ